jgi:cysteine desulfurase
MTEARIYLDYAATSPVDPAVADAMWACLLPDGEFGNPASPHFAGLAARRVIDDARDSIGALLNASAERLLFTSGATEANNIALSCRFRHEREARHLVTSRIEHRSVLDTAAALEREGIEVTRLDCDAHGIVAPDSVAQAIKPTTGLVSIMQVNNEIGTIQDIAAIAAVCRDAGVPLHVDAAQGAGKVPLDILGWGVDLCSLTAHKLNGPKGIGALYVSERVELAPLLYGGEAALGIRAGTMPTHQIAGFGRAFALAQANDESGRLRRLRERLWQGLAAIPGSRRNGDAARTAPHILSVSFPGVEGESLRFALSDIAVSAGSACTSASPAPSHVLSSLGLSDVLAESTLRFGVGRFTTESEVDTAIARVTAEVTRLREIAAGAPIWCSS